MVVVRLAVDPPPRPGHLAPLQVLPPEPRARVWPLRLEDAEGVVREVVREHEPPLRVVVRSSPRSDDLGLESQDLWCVLGSKSGFLLGVYTYIHILFQLQLNVACMSHAENPRTHIKGRFDEIRIFPFLCVVSLHFRHVQNLNSVPLHVASQANSSTCDCESVSSAWQRRERQRRLSPSYSRSTLAVIHARKQLPLLGQ